MILFSMVVETCGCGGQGKNGFFSVKSCYSFLEGMYLEDGEVIVGDREVLRYLWKG